MIQKEISNTSTETEKFAHKNITGDIIGCSLEVHSRLGPGLLESVYEEALAHEFKLAGIIFERQKEIFINYKGHSIGKHRIDFLIENKVILELKAVQTLHSIHQAQLLTYMRAMNKQVGLLINFNVDRLKNGIKRLIINI